MKILQLRYPIKPLKINQPYGVYRPDVYSQFGFTDHNGVDFGLGKDGFIRAEFPCEVVKTNWQPNGGGLSVSVLSLDEYDFKDGKAFILIDYLHLKEIKKLPGGTNYKAEAGEILAVGDNTGFSTGPHCHAQYRRVRKVNGKLINVDKNNANNSFDPMPYYTGEYAIDFGTNRILRALSEAFIKVGQLLAKWK